MKITPIWNNKKDQMSLILSADTKKESDIIAKWYSQIIGSLSKLKLEGELK